MHFIHFGPYIGGYGHQEIILNFISVLWTNCSDFNPTYMYDIGPGRNGFL
jgi:hypothetical protein